MVGSFTEKSLSKPTVSFSGDDKWSKRNFNQLFNFLSGTSCTETWSQPTFCLMKTVMWGLAILVWHVILGEIWTSDMFELSLKLWVHITAKRNRMRALELMDTCHRKFCVKAWATTVALTGSASAAWFTSCWKVTVRFDSTRQKINTKSIGWRSPWRLNCPTHTG